MTIRPDVVLECTQEQFEGIHRDLDKVRTTSKSVKVDREALQALLMDYSNCLQKLTYIQKEEVNETTI